MGRTGNPPDWSSLRSMLIACVAWSFFNLDLIVLLGFGADLLATRGMAVVDASALTSISLWIAILSIPLGGLLVQRSMAPGLLAGLSYVAAAAALVALCLDAWPVAALIAFGLALGPGPGAIMALPSRVLRPEHRITGLGIFYSLYGVIVGAGPWPAGRGRANACCRGPSRRRPVRHLRAADDSIRRDRSTTGD